VFNKRFSDIESTKGLLRDRPLTQIMMWITKSIQIIAGTIAWE